MEDARRLVKGYVEHYNNVRLNSAIGYIAPQDMLAGHQQEIYAERDRKLEAARQQRKNRRQRPSLTNYSTRSLEDLKRVSLSSMVAVNCMNCGYVPIQART